MRVGDSLRAVEICAGAGGQAIGLEAAGFDHVALVEIDRWACETLRSNRPDWPVVEGDVKTFPVEEYGRLALVAGGVPCPPFSIAGRQLGELDDRDLFPAALDLIERSRPEAVMLENVRGLLGPIFAGYRSQVQSRLASMGYWSEWRLLNASDFGVPQLRPRSVLVGLREAAAPHFQWPTGPGAAPSVGEVLRSEMASRGWEGASEWAARADGIAPTLVGGSRRHGGPDLGPTRAKAQWATLGVDGTQLADQAPDPEFAGNPRLTVRMTALLQGFPREWAFMGKKTPAYRQVGNAFPPPVARAVGTAIRDALIQARATESAEAGKTPTLTLWPNLEGGNSSDDHRTGQGSAAIG